MTTEKCWSANAFDEVINEIIEARRDGKLIYVDGLKDEIIKSAQYCGIEHISANIALAPEALSSFGLLNVAWFYQDKLHLESIPLFVQFGSYNERPLWERRMEYEL